MPRKRRRTPTHDASPSSTQAVDRPSAEFRMMAVLGVFAAALYANTIGNRFAFDDLMVVQHNSFTRQGLAGIPNMLTTFYWAGAWDHNNGMYRPLSLVGFAVQWQFFKDDPTGYHVVSVLLYVITVLLLFGTLRALLTSYSPVVAFVAALIFAAHPTHTEVVANIKSQDELLCFILALATVVFVLKHIDIRSPKYVLLSCASFFLTLLAKESGVVFLGAIPLLLYFFRSLGLKATAKEMAPLVVVTVLWFALHQWAVASNAPPIHAFTIEDSSLAGASTFLEREATAFCAMGKYLLLLVFPYPLSYDYSYNEIPITSFANANAIVPLLVCAGLIFIAIREAKEKSLFSFGVLFFFITISMTSNLFVLVAATMADRFLYVPSLGFCILLTYLSMRLLAVPDHTQSLQTLADLRFLPIFILLALYSYKTYTRNLEWHDNLTLFTTDVHSSPGSARAHFNAGSEMVDRLALPIHGQEDDTRKRVLHAAIGELETAVRIDSTAFVYRVKLAYADMYDDNYADAARQASVAIRISGTDAKAYFVLGAADYSLGKYDDAVRYLTIATTRGLDDEGTWDYLGAAYSSTDNFGKARDCFENALRVNPQSAYADKNLGIAYDNLHQFDKALDAFKRALDVNPSDPGLNQLVGMTYEQLGDAANARRYYGLAHRSTRQPPEQPHP